MTDLRNAWKERIGEALKKLAADKGAVLPDMSSDAIVAEFPPKPELGDIGFPMFGYAKSLRMSPTAIAADLAGRLQDGGEGNRPARGTAKAVGPYLNVFYDRPAIAASVLGMASPEESSRHSARPLDGRRIMIEFSCPNTNKPLHLGHLRNNVLGESLSRILKAAGADVRKVNLINDRGVHICKSMLSYQVYGGSRKPADEEMKSDHFVGKYYVLFNKLKEEDPKAEEKAQEMLRKWEDGDPDIRALWTTMNDWAVSGIKETYKRQGVDFDRYYFESQTYMTGKSEVLDGLSRGIFYRESDGSVWANLEDIGLDRKVLLRKDGTSLYMTQDIGTAIQRHKDWPFDELVYVVASEQQYHFKVLFELLKRLGHDWASYLHHLSYGLVNLPTGRMKTREGTVVDADDLIDELAKLAAQEISSKGREETVGDISAVAEKVALGALHYYLLQTSPTKDMLYDPEQSLSFTGDTGPYIQYMGARASSIVRKHESGEGNARNGKLDFAAFSNDADWALVRSLASYPAALELAARTMEPSVLASYAHDVASDFSAWYRDNPVLASPDPDVAASRLELVRAVKEMLRDLCGMLCIPFLEVM